LRRSLTCPDASPREISSAASALAALGQTEVASIKMMADVEEKLGERAEATTRLVALRSRQRTGAGRCWRESRSCL
jgi:hypothetical protein